MYDENLFVDRGLECDKFASLLQPGTPQAGMRLTADDKMGKTWLISKLVRQVRATAPDASVAYLDFRHPREKYQMQDALGLVPLLRDKLNQPAYFEDLNAAIQRANPAASGANISALQRLSDELGQHFSQENLNRLARYLDQDPENFPHDVKPAFAFALVSFFAAGVTCRL